MHKDLIVELLEQTEASMKGNIQKKDSGPSLQDAIEAIVETDEYTFLRYYDLHIDTDEYVINFIRFIGAYTASPEKIARIFSLFITNIRRTHLLFQNPAIQFMANPSKENLLMGFFIDRNTLIGTA